LRGVRWWKKWRRVEGMESQGYVMGMEGVIMMNVLWWMVGGVEATERIDVMGWQGGGKGGRGGRSHLCQWW